MTSMKNKKRGVEVENKKPAENKKSETTAVAVPKMS